EAFLPVAKAPEPPKEREMQNVTSLLSNDGVARTAGQPAPAREASALESAIDKADTLVHICMNHLHMQAMINAINNDATDTGVNHHFLIVRERSIPGFTINADA